ncbi:MAG TPA: alpha/beta fold hydrolase [Ktedonobacterales bacterium]|nr:alpha/beta fold hydrolase [Ktedonobacterales bacterium]
MLCILGQPRVAVGDAVETLALRPKALALLAYLALEQRPVARRKLAHLLFPQTEEPLALLRWHLTYLRSSAPAFIVSELLASRATIALDVSTDVALFRQGASHICDTPEMPSASAVLALYRDDLLTGLSVSTSADFDNWLYVEQEGLRRLFRQAAMTFARWAVRGDRVAASIAPLARLVTIDPYFEDGHIQLLEAYEALGQRDHAAIVYERYQRLLRRDLHAEPRPSVVRRFEGDTRPGPLLPREAMVPLREVTVHIVEWPGEEPTILGIHGSAGIAHSMSGLAELLTPANRFVAPDLRGHGYSDKPPVGYDLERHVADVLELIDALDLRRPLLLGHSAGGTIATFVAAHADVAGLILLDGMVGDRAFAENAAAQLAPMIGRLGQRFGGYEPYLMEWRASRPPRSDEAERLLERWVRYDLAPLPDGTYRRRALQAALEAEWASIVQADSLGALARVQCPVLIVQGGQSWASTGRPYLTAAIVAAQVRAARSAELFVARQSDHSALVRSPEPEMAAAIATFARRHGRQASPSHAMPLPAQNTQLGSIGG